MKKKNAFRWMLGAMFLSAIILANMGQNTVRAAAITVQTQPEGGGSWTSDLVGLDTKAVAKTVGDTAAFVTPTGASTTGAADDTDNFHISVSYTAGDLTQGRLEVALGTDAMSGTVGYMWDETSTDQTLATAWVFAATDDTSNYALGTAVATDAGVFKLYCASASGTDWTNVTLTNTTAQTLFATWATPSTANPKQIAFVAELPDNASQATGTYGTVLVFTFTPTG